MMSELTPGMRSSRGRKGQQLRSRSGPVPDAGVVESGRPPVPLSRFLAPGRLTAG